MGKKQTNGELSMEEFSIDCFVLKSNYDLATFERKAYIELFSNLDVSASIAEANFGSAKEVYWQFYLMEGKYRLTYKTEIGYNRTEQYWATEKKYKDGRSYEERVLKERTITDWQPYSGKEFGTAWSSAMMMNPISEYFENTSDEGESSQTSRFEACVVTGQRFCDTMDRYAQADCAMRPIMPSEKNKEYARQSGEWDVAYYIKDHLPGDENRNFTYSSSCEVLNEAQVTVPAYVLPFELDEKKYAVDAYAFNGDVNLTMVPRDEVGKEIDQKNKKFRRLTRYIPMGVFFLLGIIFATTGNQGLSMMFILLVIGWVIGHAVFFYLKQKKQEEQAHELSQNAKKQALIALFKKLGLGDLTEEELQKFDAWKQKKK